MFTGSPSCPAVGTQPAYCVSSVPVHSLQAVLRSPRTPISGGRSRPSLEAPVPAVRGLATSRPLSVETESLPGTVGGERSSCRSHCPFPASHLVLMHGLLWIDLGCPQDTVGQPGAEAAQRPLCGKALGVTAESHGLARRKTERSFLLCPRPLALTFCSRS